MNMNMNVTPLVRFFGFVSASHNSFVGCLTDIFVDKSGWPQFGKNWGISKAIYGIDKQPHLKRHYAAINLVVKKRSHPHF